MRSGCNETCENKQPSCAQNQKRGGNAGRGAGTLTVIGLGPGGAELLAPQAQEAIESAAVVVGYRTYIDLIDPALLEGREVVSTGMMGEVERCTAAVDKALAGFDTVVVSSGDSGIYGMSGLVMEILESKGLLETVDFRVVPGIPALAAAASLLGAPLMHDFAVISLSDLLTPWEVIEKRLEAAAAADFVTVLYNPRSKRRASHLPRALEIVSRHRSPETPVGLVRNAYREEQEISAFKLEDTDASTVDMLSILVIGNSTTRFAETRSGKRLLTPRGYSGKYNLK